MCVVFRSNRILTDDLLQMMNAKAFLTVNTYKLQSKRVSHKYVSTCLCITGTFQIQFSRINVDTYRFDSANFIIFFVKKKKNTNMKMANGTKKFRNRSHDFISELNEKSE